MRRMMSQKQIDYVEKIETLVDYQPSNNPADRQNYLTVKPESGPLTVEVGNPDERNKIDINGTVKINANSKIVDSSGNEIKAVIANPTEDTTGTLSKIKIGDTAYAVGGGDNTLLIFASSNVGQTGNYEFYADTTISDDAVAKLVNGDIKVISGTFVYKDGNIGYFSTSYCGNKSEYGENYDIYEGVNVNSSTNKLEKFNIKYNTTSHPNSISLRYVQYVLTRG